MALSLEAGKDLFETCRHQRLLSSEQLRIFEAHLTNAESWRPFIELDLPSSNTTDTAHTDSYLTPNQVVAMQIRTIMLERRASSLLFPLARPPVRATMPPQPPSTSASKNERKRLREEDDYDDSTIEEIAESGVAAAPVVAVAPPPGLLTSTSAVLSRRSSIVIENPNIPVSDAVLERLFAVDDSVVNNGIGYESRDRNDVDPIIELDDCYYTLETETEDWVAYVAEQQRLASLRPPDEKLRTELHRSISTGVREQTTVATNDETSGADSVDQQPQVQRMPSAVSLPNPTLPASTISDPAPNFRADRPSSRAALVGITTPILPPMQVPTTPHIQETKLGSTGFKYLWEALANQSAQHKDLAINATELRLLLTDVKPSRSKWYDPSKINQEELYLACENVLKLLINFKSHSWPFLQPVSKKLAKDYDTIVKRPMALETMQHKLKMFQYRSKQEFVDDLYLIISNCLLYNGTDPSNEYVRHADALKKKMDILVTKIPDIVVKDRSPFDQSEDDEMFGILNLTDESSQSMPAASETHQNEHVVVDDQFSAPAEDNTMTDIEAFLSEDLRSPAAEPVEASTASNMTQSEGDTTDQKDSLNLSDSQTNGDLKIDSETLQQGSPFVTPIAPDQPLRFGDGAPTDRTLWQQRWRRSTQKLRAELYSHREQLDHLPFSEQPALHRSAVEMGRFYRSSVGSRTLAISSNGPQRLSWNEPREIQIELTAKIETSLPVVIIDENLAHDVDTTMTDTSPRRKPESFNASSYPLVNGLSSRERAVNVFFPEYSLQSSIPYLPRTVLPVSELPNDSVKKRVKLLRPAAYLDSLVYANIGTLRDIRLLRARIERDIQPNKSQIAIAQAPPVSDETYPLLLGVLSGPNVSMEAPTLAPQRIVDEKIESSMPTSHDSESAKFGLTQALILLLQHAGFEAVHAFPVDVLVEVTGSFFAKFGRLFRTYCDAYSKTMSEEELLLQCMSEMGMERLSSVEAYWREEIVRYRQKLLDVQRKLEVRFLELNGGIDGLQEESHQTEDLAFMSGNFSEDVDLDLLGLKELGLGAIKVPNSLLVSRTKRTWVTRERLRKQLAESAELAVNGIEKETLVVATSTKDSNLAPRFPPPPPFPPISSVENHIGLLREFLEAELQDKQTVVEDDALSPDQRQQRKRISRELDILEADQRLLAGDDPKKLPKTKKRSKKAVDEK